MRSLLMRVQLGRASARSRVEHRLPICLSCNVGGQLPPYILIQLFMFRERLRASAPMNGGIKGLCDDDLQSVSAATAKLPPPGPCSQKISHCGGKCAVAFEL
jgi:hypothetical protein